METLAERLDALQEKLLELYEDNSADLTDQIKHYDLTRRENVLMYYAKQKGLSRLGLQTLPSLRVSETNAKNAIMMGIYLTKLRDSIFGHEPWTLTETSYDLFMTAPQYTFKKGPFVVTVVYDKNDNNSYEYPCWDAIYYLDEYEIWHKTKCSVSAEGLYYRDHTGTNVYFVTFKDDATRFSTTGTWDVYFKNNRLSSVASPTGWGSSLDSSSSSGEPTSPTPRDSAVTPSRRRRKETRQRQRRQDPRPEPTVQRRGRRQGESPLGRRPTGSSWPTAEEVGRRHRSVTGRNLSRLERLQIEARDPPIIIVKGDSSNLLKCWRNRCKKHSCLYLYFSTIFKWLGGGVKGQKHRMIISFRDSDQRKAFLATVRLPKGASYAYGSLDSL